MLFNNLRTIQNEVIEMERDLEQIMIDLLENTQDSIYVKNKHGAFLVVSRVKAERSGTTWQKMIEKTDFDFLPENEAAESWADDMRIMTTGTPIVDKVEKITHNGIETWVSTTKTPRRNKEGEIIGIMGISRDITARHSAEEDLKNTNAKMLTMLGIAKHDIRNRVIAMVGIIRRLLNKRYADADEAYRELLSLAQFVEKIINEYLQQEFFNESDLPKKNNFDLDTDIIQPLLDKFSQLIDSNNIRIDNRLGGIPPNAVTITNEEEVALKIIYLNLIENALRYGGKNIKIAFGYEKTDKFLKLNIFNEGPPVPEEDRGKIFDEGFTTGTRTIGEGLPRCRELARCHGGDLLYEPTQNGYPNFILLWPQNN